jgi:hypothetical protein
LPGRSKEIHVSACAEEFQIRDMNMEIIVNLAFCKLKKTITQQPTEPQPTPTNWLDPIQPTEPQPTPTNWLDPIQPTEKM